MTTDKTARRSALVLDDDEHVRRLVVHMVRSTGLLAIEAACIAEAEAAAREHGDRLAIALLDVHLPDGLGVDFCDTLKGMDGLADLPVLMLTSDDSGQMAERAFDSDTVRYLLKPFDPIEVQELISTYARA